MGNKALVIDVAARSAQSGSLYKWDSIGNIESFTRDIITPVLDRNADKNAIVSGIPTVFARPNLFALALGYSGDSMTISSASLNCYYEELVEEWFGLIACIALDSGNLSVRRVTLAYSDGKEYGETDNLYEPKGAIGNMLFERADLWCEQTKDNGKKHPFIDIIKHKGKVIGGTSPETLLFTAASYQIEPDARFAPEGRFVNPLTNGNIKGRDLLALYAYVKTLVERINGDFSNYYANLREEIRPKYQHISKRLEDWLQKMRERIDDDIENATANPVSVFSAPFSTLFNYSDDLYGYNGIIVSQEQPGFQKFSAEDLLLPKSSEIARFILSRAAANNITKLPVYLLAASYKNEETSEKAFFALPLSEEGMKIFGSEIDDILGYRNETTQVKTRLTAEFDREARVLEVTLYIETEEHKTNKTFVPYQIKQQQPIQGVDLLLWPNFVSNQWKKYFMYSEMPSNATTERCAFNAIPFFGENKEGQFVPLITNAGLLTVSPEDRLVLADHRVANSNLKYEIYESDKPYAGVRLSCGKDNEGKVREGGVLLIRYSQHHNNETLPMNKLNDAVNFKPKGVSLGFDFGSTNTSIAYFDPNRDDSINGEGLMFTNHRVSLLGSDIKEVSVDGHPVRAQKLAPKDLFFFPAPSKPIASNALKSMLTIHDQKRLDESRIDVLRGEPIAGGIPCLNQNLPIYSITNDKITLDFGNRVEASVISNMKWRDSDLDKSYKKAYLKTLLLMVYVELFEKGLRPERLNWSYPSAMEKFTIDHHYSPIWESLTEVSPIYDVLGNPCKLVVMRSAEQNNNGQGFVDDTFNFGGVGNTSPVNSSPSDFIGGSSDSFNFSDFGAGNSTSAGNPFARGGQSQQSSPFNAVQSSKDRFTKPVQQSNVSGPKIPNFEPDDPKKVLEFDAIQTDKPMSEACASANFTSQATNVGQNLVVSFDVGGSTTDISALYNLTQGQTSMIKQSSIRFAAQRISSAVHYMPEDFRKVLTKVCNAYHITLLGFNEGEDRYNADTASYYYEQIVDILTEDNQLKFFYNCIAADCPRLFAVNMFVTGLILFYAGQLSNTLIDAVDANLTSGLPQPQGFQIAFEGKGARIFDWLSTNNYNAAVGYFKAMFIQGFGGGIDPSYIDLSMLNAKSSPDVKFEVSKGLAMQNGTLRVPKESFEVFGEDGYQGFSQDNRTFQYNFATKLTPEWMEHIGGFIRQTSPQCPCLAKFCQIFASGVSQILGLQLDVNQFKQGLSTMNIDQYIQQELAPFRQAKERAQKSGNFDYVAPIIIIEGIKFYEKNLLKCFA